MFSSLLNLLGEGNLPGMENLGWVQFMDIVLGLHDNFAQDATLDVIATSARCRVFGFR